MVVFLFVHQYFCYLAYIFFVARLRKTLWICFEDKSKNILIVHNIALIKGLFLFEVEVVTYYMTKIEFKYTL